MSKNLEIALSLLLKSQQSVVSGVRAVGRGITGMGDAARGATGEARVGRNNQRALRRMNGVIRYAYYTLLSWRCLTRRLLRPKRPKENYHRKCAH
jgi:hypothetical protein